MTLPEFIAHAGRTPFAWGRHDCSLWLADWLVARGWPDPAAALRGRYATAGECEALLDAEGGLAAVIAACARAAGLVPTAEPAPGDVGVVRVLTRSGPATVGAICTGPRWAVLSEGGVSILPARPLAAWRV